jgi:hypothetical protein
MNRLRIAPLILLLLLPAAAAGGRLPGHHPDTFPYAGTVDGIDLKNMTLHVSDTRQTLSAVVTVHDRSGSNGSLLQLREGMEIGYRKQSAGTRGAPISEIWILPKGYLDSKRMKQRH